MTMDANGLRLIADSIGIDTGDATMSIETNRREALAGAAASGLAASVLASPATAQGTSVMAVATDADYQRDPTRWGSAEIAAQFSLADIKERRHIDDHSWAQQPPRSASRMEVRKLRVAYRRAVTSDEA
jgi:hypothetical protein